MAVGESVTDRHTLHPFCVVCGAQLPHLPRDEAIQKGAAFTMRVDNGPERTFYKCIGRHTAEEILRAIRMIPTFSRARKASVP